MQWQTKPYVSVTMQTLGGDTDRPSDREWIDQWCCRIKLGIGQIDWRRISHSGSGEWARAILIDKQGTVVAHQNKDFILKQVNDIAPELSVSGLNSAGVQNLTTIFTK